ncbi:MerR family transcriptional regulator [Gimesia fumaroli]|uniref:Helix-turn-helix domain protein n=1 Tax=Gimesia fumaroli TaxID=2527976 RepID=A0A518IA43_9PLAN|nr:helix-turn-helix domain-containing protein [Gimesia fumaroli]QDV49996.1 Helix-turn-helix domain protein [Gimesia fumaroli]
MNEFLTPKQVARAIQASESSVKRWCDKGIIPTQYTAGGHRRIALSELIEFLRSSKYELVRPEVLGLPATTGQTIRVIDRAANQITEALLLGDEEQCRQIVLDLYLAEHSISSICDLVFAKAFATIGNRWQCGDAEVYQERRGCELALRVLHELRTLIPSPPAEAPLAIGGAAEGDQYTMATTMVELVLRDIKWNAVSLGANLPFTTLAAAIKQHRPKLFWLSVSYVPDETEFIRAYSELYDEFGLDVAFVVGGRALHESIRQEIQYAAFCDNIRHLEAFAQTLLSATGKQSAT